jgi:hypothetical protein
MVCGVILVLAWGAAAAAAPKDPCELENCVETDVYGEGGDALAMGEGGEMMLLGVGDTVEMCRDHACWTSYDACLDAARLPLGVGTGTYGTGGRSAAVDANFDDYYCGWGADVGDVAQGDDLLVNWPGATIFDETTSDGGQTKFQIWIYQDTGASCTGNRTYKGGDTATCTTLVNRKSWTEALAEGRADCEGALTDPGDCHLPDVLLVHPASATDAWYYYIMQVSVCNADGTNCWTNSESGCFNVYWM